MRRVAMSLETVSTAGSGTSTVAVPSSVSWRTTTCASSASMSSVTAVTQGMPKMPASSEPICAVSPSTAMRPQSTRSMSPAGRSLAAASPASRSMPSESA